MVTARDLGAFRARVPGWHANALDVGMRWEVDDADVVSSAPELARLTLNIAAAHHDQSRTGRRLVSGGHTIGLAAAQVTCAIPNLVMVLAWHSCDHLNPVYEGDLLVSAVELEALERPETGGALLHLRSSVRAKRQEAALPVLDWRFAALMA